MEVDQVVAFLHYFFRDQPRCSVSLRPIGIARIKAVHALAVNRIHMRHFLLKGREVHQRNDDQFSRHLRRIDRLNELLQGNNGCILCAMRSRNESQSGTWLASIYHDDGNVSGSIGTGRYF